jgi:hypothetical protein
MIGKLKEHLNMHHKLTADYWEVVSFLLNNAHLFSFIKSEFKRIEIIKSSIKGTKFTIV